MLSQSDQLLLRSQLSHLTIDIPKLDKLSWECAILHRSGRLLLYPERMYFNIIASENIKREASLLG